MNPEYKEINDKLTDLLIASEAMRQMAASNHKAFRDFESETKEFRNKLNHTLFGNGKPEEGLFYKTHENTKFRLFWERFGWVVLVAVAGIPCTIVASVCVHLIRGGGVG